MDTDFQSPIFSENSGIFIERNRKVGAFLQSICTNNCLVKSLSVEGLNHRTMLEASPPIIFGVGFGSNQLSFGLPLDVMTMILTAEKLRRDVGLGSCYILCGDDAALSNIGTHSSFIPSNIRAAAHTTRGLLQQVVERLGMSGHWNIFFGSQIEEIIGSAKYKDYQQIVSELMAQGVHRYFALETAQIWALAGQKHGGVKIGWFMRNTSSYESEVTLDEKPFDDFYRKFTREMYIEDTVSTVYTRAGVSMKPGHKGHAKKLSPYVCYDSNERLMIDPNESALKKLDGLNRRNELPYMSTVYRHYFHLARLFERVIYGKDQFDKYDHVPERIQAILDLIS